MSAQIGGCQSQLVHLPSLPSRRFLPSLSSSSHPFHLPPIPFIFLPSIVPSRTSHPLHPSHFSPPSCQLLLPDGRRFATESTALHPSADLAVLKVTHRLFTRGPTVSAVLVSGLQGIDEPAVSAANGASTVAGEERGAVAVTIGDDKTAADRVGSTGGTIPVDCCRGVGSREADGSPAVAGIFGEVRAEVQETGGEGGVQRDGGERAGERDGREGGEGSREDKEWLPCAPIGDSDDVELADWVISVGNPVGLPGSISLGVISSLHRTAAQVRKGVDGGKVGVDGGVGEWQRADLHGWECRTPHSTTSKPTVGVPHSSLHFFQTDCAINPGSSGSPLVNEFGELRQSPCERVWGGACSCVKLLPLYATCCSLATSYQSGELRQSFRERVWRGGLVLLSQSSADVGGAV
ncbi:unnamed protein product [Closterium sp. NIES-65]|nr:unnamed protein product [Closterium sp. NIES-65]